MPLAPGLRLAQYEILGPLGSGGMGDVYRARDMRLGRDVAIKVMAPHIASDPDMRQRFETEARAVASLSHPGILSITSSRSSTACRSRSWSCSKGASSASG